MAEVVPPQVVPQARPAHPSRSTFGHILIERGLLTVAQLDEALATQRERERRGDFARLGHILVEMGFLTPAQVQEVLQVQAIVILTCQGCAAQYNIRGFTPRFRYECPKCHSELKSAEELSSVAVQDQLQVDAQAEPEDTVKLTRPEETNTAKIRLLRKLGKYEILGEIARGGMGIIYKARQVDLDRIVALKTLRQEEIGKPDGQNRFLHEAQAVAVLRHPNIVAVHEVGTTDGIDYFTMEFIEGLPLDRLLIRESLAPRRAVEIILPIAEALEYAHSKAVIHRDIKPGNIIIDTETGTPFLVDFGIAEKVKGGPRQVMDEEEDLLGSIPYMAPEYVEGSAYDELCDLYSLGVVLYEALAGANALPYYDDDTRRFLEMIVEGKNKPITRWIPDLDQELVRILEGMIARRAERYSSMGEVVREMRRWLLAHEDPPQEAEAAPAAAVTPPPLVVTRTSNAAVVGWFAAGFAVLGLMYTGQELAQARGQLESQRLESLETSLGHDADLIRVELEHARLLVALGQRERAEEACTRVIQRFQSRELPPLAAAYRLRAELRDARGAPEARDDLRRAARLEGSTIPNKN